MHKKTLLGLLLAFTTLSAFAGRMSGLKEKIEVNETTRQSLVTALNNSEMEDEEDVDFEISGEDRKTLLVTHPLMNQALAINLADNNGILEDALLSGFKKVIFTNGKDYTLKYDVN